MSFDRIDNFSGGAPGGLPRRSMVTPSMQQQSVSELDSTLPGVIAGRGTTQNNSNVPMEWATKVAMWGGREWLANVVNQATAPVTKVGQTLNTAQQELYKKLNIKSSQNSATQNPALPKTYSNLLHLGTDKIQAKELSLSKYTQTVKDNLRPFKAAASPKHIRNFFADVTPKSYLKETVIESNIKPIKDLVNNSPNKQIGSGILQTAALGLLGYDAVKHTVDTYHSTKAKEDGSIQSKLNTAKETTVAFGKYAFRNIATWEAAGVGAAIGRALIPIALGPVGIGGIAIGALVGLGTQKALDHALSTGSKDPVQQEKLRKKQQGETAQVTHRPTQEQAEPGDNPFQIQPA